MSDGSISHLAAVLDDLLDALGELKQGRRQPIEPRLRSALDALARDLQDWVPQVADAITAGGSDPLAVSTSVAGHHPAALFPHGGASADVAAVIADHLEVLAARAGAHAAAISDADPGSALLATMERSLRGHRAEIMGSATP